MRVMTFNIRGAYWQGDGANFWPNRSALNVATITGADPDLIGFQECQDGNLDVYASQLPAYRLSLGPRYGNQAPFEYVCIAWRPDRLRLAAAGGFWLSTTPEWYSAAWETDCIRSAQWARFQPIDGGPPFVLLNTHLDHISAEARLEGARLIVARLATIAAPGEAAIITGDFNCDPDSPPYRVFQEAGFEDTFAAGQSDLRETHTFHGFQGREYPLQPGRDERIDWILTRGMRAGRCEIVRGAQPPVYPSDHYPVVADVEQARAAK